MMVDLLSTYAALLCLCCPFSGTFYTYMRALDDFPMFDGQPPATSMNISGGGTADILFCSLSPIKIQPCRHLSRYECGQLPLPANCHITRHFLNRLLHTAMSPSVWYIMMGDITRCRCIFRHPNAKSGWCNTITGCQYAKPTLHCFHIRCRCISLTIWLN